MKVFSEEGIIEVDGQPTTEPSTNKQKQNRINTAIVENNSFRDFIKECNIKWNPVSTKHLKHDTIARFTEKVNKTIHETLHATDYLTLTVDGCLDRRCRSFLDITCHFINFKTQPESYLIDFVRLKSPHTGENIHQTTEGILDRFNIKEKVYK
ncbi:unnamed protein product [Rotaria sp. Silwood2]|nr:unnamed protein product [Rotaria sp. Silwood2]CAF4452490.1 unnamed protein product [Rotaria sp. Silwood2]